MILCCFSALIIQINLVMLYMNCSLSTITQFGWLMMEMLVGTSKPKKQKIPANITSRVHGTPCNFISAKHQ